MCLVDKKVNHKIFGEGIIKSCDEKYLHVVFGQEEKIFSYPSVFEKFITIEDKEAKEKIKSDIEILHEKAQILLEAKKKKEIQYISQPIEPQKTSTKLLEATKTPSQETVVAENTETKTVSKQTKSRSKGSIKNLAIKFNYCDGGQFDDNMGYCGICSPSQMDYNVNKQRNNKICNSPECVCKKFLFGEIQEEDFKKIVDSNTFICNERDLLKNWRIKIDSSKLAGILQDSLVIMTTKFKSTDEKDRFVFAVFMTAGTLKEGESEFIVADEKYRIELKKSEAVKIKFWNHHTQTGKTKNNWGTTSFKLLTPEDSASILKEILETKIGTDEENTARDLYEHFAEINDLDLNLLERDTDEQSQQMELF